MSTNLPTAAELFCASTVAEYGSQTLEQLLQKVRKLATNRGVWHLESETRFASLKQCFIDAGDDFVEKFGLLALEHVVVELAHATNIRPSVMSGPARKRHEALKAGRLVGRYAEKRYAN